MGSGGTLSPAEIEIIRNTPAAAPPSGTEPNFANPPNENKLAIGIISGCLALAITASLIRTYARIFCMRIVRLEDYLGVLALIFYIGAICILATIPHGTGLFVHHWDLRMQDLEWFIYYYIITSILYCCMLMSIKAAILLEWSHIFVPRTSRNLFFWACHVTLCVNSFLYAATIVTTNLACTPRDRIWQRWLVGTCININGFNIVTACLDLFLDVVMLLLPHGAIWKLSLTTRQKVGVSAIFSVGVVACVSAAGRVVSALNMSHSDDVTYAYSSHLIWGLAELTAGQLVFCVPGIPIAFRDVKPLQRLTHWLSSKAKRSTFHQPVSSTNTTRRSWAIETHGVTSFREYQRMEAHVETGAGELELVRTPSNHSNTQLQATPVREHGGIMRTTEIQITSFYNESDSGLSSTQ